MNIRIDKNLVSFTPENDDEAENLELLWRHLVDCVKFNKKLVPVGEYFAKDSEKRIARFSVED